ncbi:hypothetical protein HYFRA_00012771 [Hymenoscyphus fraxineus]|uniref:Vacuolar calcium ion transporter n=1 Tax=Hymenoscyphus fraxineus TaxID=746836 RepID=A0A9N9L541_9HELO|nr:hypothetical protein HYFRA_00012771 [Hymenoscyphus fraxineus]
MSSQRTSRRSQSHNIETPSSPAKAHTTSEKHHSHILPTHHRRERPTHNHNGHKITRGIKPEGESGRRGIHPWHFFRICFRSSCNASRLVNILWPVVPAAIAVRFVNHDKHLLIFILNYVAMLPCANMIGFAGQELARKLPKVFGVLLETTVGSLVEIILFMVLLKQNAFLVIQAAILGSILATQLLCLGLCFFAGGMRREESEFEGSVSEVGSNLLLTAGLGLIIPAIFYQGVKQTGFVPEVEQLTALVVSVSRVTSVFLIVAYIFYIWFQMRTHHGLYDAIFEQDELKDTDRHRDLAKDKLTLTECIIALSISVALVTLIAIGLVDQIEYIVEERGVSDLFMGLILVPLVEKFAEHITAIDEAWDNQMNFALSHVLGATIQTALLNAPLTVLVGWGLKKQMDFNFDIFSMAALILAILVVGNFLRDQRSNYLEGALCVIVYCIIAVAAFYFPNDPHHFSGSEAGGSAHAAVGEHGGAKTSAAAHYIN